MRYEIEFRPKALRDLKGLSPQISSRILNKLEDAGLSRILRQAKRDDAGEPGIPFAEVKRQLAARRKRKYKN